MENRKRDRYNYNERILCLSYKFDKYSFERESEKYNIRIPFLFNIKNISYSGMAITTTEYLRERMVLNFRLSDGMEGRNFKAEVKWCRKSFGMNYLSGLKFVELTEKDVVFLFKFVQKIKN